MRLQLPDKLRPAFEGPARYRGAHGGRGSAKSDSFAQMALARGMEKPRRILCTREIQNSIRESVHAGLCSWIQKLGVSWFYDMRDNYIRGMNGTEFIYKGLWRNLGSIKSLHGVDICWVEEAENVSEKSWETLDPTIRAPGSEIWATWNPERTDSPTKTRLIDSKPGNARIVEMNWRDNPWFPPELDVLRQQDMRRDYEKYLHIWEGQCITRSEAQIFRDKWEVDYFQPQADWDGPYYGADWGFSTDPSVLVRCWIKDRVLYIEYEAHGYHVELDDLPGLFDGVPGARQFKIRADSSRPETISHVNRAAPDKLGRGFKVEAVEKWPGSVEDGIAVMRSFDRIVVHPRCPRAAEEFRLYSYKVDRLTGDVLTDIVDKHNHCIDAIRYALAPFIKRSGWGFFDV